MTPATVIEKANARARVKPQLDAYVNGEHRYTFEAGNLYPIYAAKGRVTTILLEPGEEISENGFYAADLQNWQYEPSGVMGHGPDERPVVVILPYHAGIRTNLSGSRPARSAAMVEFTIESQQPRLLFLPGFRRLLPAVRSDVVLHRWRQLGARRESA
jgi:type IV secretory pathway VirB9-like protein